MPYLRHTAENPDGFARHFRADTVSGQSKNFKTHFL
jgi:hypothetical protein